MTFHFLIRKVGTFVFLNGGIVFSIYALLSIRKKNGTHAMLDLKNFVIAMYSLLVFVVLATMSFQQLFESVFGSYEIQSVNNLMVGVSFLFFLWRLWRSIIFEEKSAWGMTSRSNDFSYNRQDDFEAEITILTEAEGGRKTPPLNGIRWDFMYDGDDIKDGLYMIWPEFTDSEGNAIPKDMPLVGKYRARMHILNREMAETFHRNRIKPGIKFFSMEGPHKVATGVILKVTGLK